MICLESRSLNIKSEHGYLKINLESFLLAGVCRFGDGFGVSDFSFFGAFAELSRVDLCF